MMHTNQQLLPEPPYWIKVLTYISFKIVFAFGHLRDLLTRFHHREGWVPIVPWYEGFYMRHFVRLVSDAFDQCICSAPGPTFTIKERLQANFGWLCPSHGPSKRVLNMGSYNYLGFAGHQQESKLEECIREHGLGSASTRNEIGNHYIYQKLEKTVAEFLGTEAAIVFGMGFGTNSMSISTLMGKGCLILSDQLNHSSLVLGSRLSTEATVRIFKHNDMKDLEKNLRTAIIIGQPNKDNKWKAWKKILIIVEGIYSMEGSIVDLKTVIALKKKYKAYLYLDEAHSIGALGPHGRGVVDYYDCDLHDVDVLMGTFTKSFGAFGGYIAGSKVLVSYLHAASPHSSYATSMSVPVAQQIIAATQFIMERGQVRISTLAWNCRYFRRRLQELGFIVYGSIDSPVVPILIYLPGKMLAFWRECFARGLATVVITYPATSLYESRARLCISAAHTKDMLDKALSIIDEVGDLLRLKYSQQRRPAYSESVADFKNRYNIGEQIAKEEGDTIQDS